MTTGHNERVTKPEPELTLESFLPFRLTLLSNAMLNMFAHSYRSHGVSTPEWRTMMILCEFPGISSDRLAEMSRTEKSVVSRLVASLLKRDLITRKVDDKDRRLTALSLSAKGVDLYNQVIPSARELETSLRGELRAADEAALNRILTQLMLAVQRREREGRPR